MKTKIPLDDARKIAAKYVGQLAPYCKPNRCRIAGSIRRQKSFVGDIEICCQPTGVPVFDLFGNIDSYRYPIYEAIKEIFVDLHFVSNGERLKKILVPDLVWDAVQIDLFIVLPPAQWGYRMAMCTGPAEYNKWLVTTKQKGGALPSNCKSKNGAIYCNGELIEMPTEESYFDFLGLDCPEPSTRKPPQSWIPF